MPSFLKNISYQDGFDDKTQNGILRRTSDLSENCGLVKNVACKDKPIQCAKRRDYFTSGKDSGRLRSISNNCLFPQCIFCSSDA